MAQLLQRAIYVDRRQAKAFREIGLGEAESIAALIGEADDSEAYRQLAEEMSHPRQGRSPSEREGPFAMDGRIEIRAQPIQPREMRVAIDQITKAFVGNDRDIARRKGEKIVIEPFQGEPMKIGEITGDMELRDLPLAVAQIFVTTHQSIQKQPARCQLDIRPHHRLIRTKFLNL